MLQTRISSRQNCLALVLVLCACMRFIHLSEAEPSRSCNNVGSFLGAEGQSYTQKGEIYEQFKEETDVNGVCKLDKTCCSHTAEVGLKLANTGNYKHKIQKLLSTQLMPCHNHTVLGDIKNYIGSSKDNLVSNMRRAFSIYFTDYVNIFDEFYGYLANAITTGDLCEVEEKFTKVSFEMFLATFVVTSSIQPQTTELPNTEAFRSCFFNYFVELRGNTINNQLTGLLRAFNLTMRYTRALKMVEKVIEGILDLPLTEQCQNALMKMTYCSQCAGYDSVDLLPCQGLCLNSLRGCLVDFADLEGPIREFSDALTNLNSHLTEPYSPWVQITQLDPYFFGIVTATQTDYATINENLFLTCDATGTRNERSAPLSKRSASPVANVKTLENMEAARERRSIGGRAIPDVPFATMNQSSYCIANAIPIFNSLSEEICEERSVGRDNFNCWTGSAFGSYDRTVIDLDRSAQKNNPELVVCTKQSRLRQQIAQLKYITRELNILTGVAVCSNDDDEDCVNTVPDTCSYYEFPSSYSLDPDMISSGSGSGDSDGDEETDEDVCGVAIVDGGEDASTAVEEVQTTTKSADPDKVSGGESGAVRHSSMTLLTLVSVSLSLAWTTVRCYL